MMRLREPFSYERHRDVAEYLVRLREELQRLQQDIDESYGAPAAGEARNAVAAVDRIREVLDTQLERDFPRDPAQVCSVRLASIYYPPRWHEARQAG
ncbi:MAG TPA: hypothetical protein VKS60_23065 [Stellaceae bacterium]|nr:hypothetical protein [Stellaceae bacterium]